MKRVLLTLSLVTLMSACSSNNDIEDRLEKMEEVQQTVVEQKTERMDVLIDTIPDWYMDVPQPDTTGVFGVGYATSNKPPFALKTAELQAKFDLAKNFKQLISGQERSYENQTLDNNVETQINMLIDSLVEEVSVAGYQRVKRELYNVDGVANAYVLMKMPYDEYNKALQSMRAKGVEEKMQLAFNQLEERLSTRKELVRQEKADAHKREVDMKELEIKQSTEVLKAEAQLEAAKASKEKVN